MHTLQKVISGGQTGADLIGLEIAKSRGIPTGGTAPKGYRTEGGHNMGLKDMYGLEESPFFDYPPRTLRNVLDSDATVLFGDMASSGSLQTIRLCIQYNRPYITNPLPEELAKWIEEKGVLTLNVAGNRGSKLNTLQKKKIADTLTEAFKLLGH